MRIISSNKIDLMMKYLRLLYWLGCGFVFIVTILAFLYAPPDSPESGEMPLVIGACFLLCGITIGLGLLLEIVFFCIRRVRKVIFHKNPEEKNITSAPLLPLLLKEKKGQVQNR